MASDTEQVKPAATSLMSLPVEIREMIFDYAFDLPSVVVFGSSAGPKFNLLTTRPAGNGCAKSLSCASGRGGSRSMIYLNFEHFTQRATSLSKLCLSCRAQYHRFAIIRVNAQLREEGMHAIFARTFQIRLSEAGIKFNGSVGSEAWERLVEVQVWRAREIHIIVDDIPKFIAFANMRSLMDNIMRWNTTKDLGFVQLELVSHGNFLWRIHAPSQDIFNNVVARRQNFDHHPIASDTYCVIAAIADDTHDPISAAVEVKCVERIAALFEHCNRIRRFRLISRIRDPILFTHCSNKYPVLFSVDIPISRDPRPRGRQLKLAKDIVAWTKMHHDLFIIDRIQKPPAQSFFRYHGKPFHY